MKSITYKDETMGADYIVGEIPADMLDEAKHYREQLIEKVSEADDKILEKYLHGEEPTEDEIKAALRKRVNSSVRSKGEAAFVPVICGSAFKNKGVQPLLDAVVDFLPSPLDVPSIAGIDPDKKPTGDPSELIERPASDDAPFSALAFKIMTDPFVGQLTFFRVYSGVLTSGGERLQRHEAAHRAHRPPAEDAREQAGRNRRGVRGRHRRGGRPQERVHGRHAVRREAPIVLESMDFPKPVISLAIEPKTKSDQEKLGVGLQKLMAEDPTFRVQTDQQTGQVIIAGMGELHLDIIVDRLKREFSVEATVGKPQVAYKETLTRPADGDG